MTLCPWSCAFNGQSQADDLTEFTEGAHTQVKSENIYLYYLQMYMYMYRYNEPK